MCRGIWSTLWNLRSTQACNRQDPFAPTTLTFNLITFVWVNGVEIAFSRANGRTLIEYKVWKLPCSPHVSILTNYRHPLELL